jgi:hypothetical protein
MKKGGLEGGTMRGHPLVALPVGRVPGIEIFTPSKRGGSLDGFVVGLIGELQGPVEPADNIDGRARRLELNDDVPGMRKVR